MDATRAAPVIAAVDASNVFSHVLASAVALAHGGRPLQVVHVIEQPGTSLLDPLHDQIDRLDAHRQRDEAAIIRQRCVEQLAAVPNLTHSYFEIVNRSGDAASKVLLAHATEMGAFALVMAQSGSAVDHLLLGSNTLRCVRDAARSFPVLVVKRPHQ